MDQFEDDLERLAASGLQSARWKYKNFSLNLKILSISRRRSSAVGSVDSGESETGVSQTKTKYRVLVMGSSKVGKTSIISQFLYDQFSTKYKVITAKEPRNHFQYFGTNKGMIY